MAFSRLTSLLRNLLRRQREERELDEEVRTHELLLADEKIRAGMNPQEAHRQARLELGGVEQVKEQVREIRAGYLLETLWQDVRFGLRMLRKSPGFTAIAVLTLALGIGANTAIFSMINALMLRALPVREPGQLVELLHRFPEEPALNGFSHEAYQLLRDQNHVFSGLIASTYQSFNVRGDDLESQAVAGGYVDGTFFTVLGVNPAIGRLIGPGDNQNEHPSSIAVLSWRYWKSKFNLDPAVVGKQILVDDVPLTVVGVAPRGFSGLSQDASQDFWLPLSMRPLISRSVLGWGSLSLVGRLKACVSFEKSRNGCAVSFRRPGPQQ
jgi:hypothetical protein